MINNKLLVLLAVAGIYGHVVLVRSWNCILDVAFSFTNTAQCCHLPATFICSMSAGCVNEDSIVILNMYIYIYICRHMYLYIHILTFEFYRAWAGDPPGSWGPGHPRGWKRCVCLWDLSGGCARGMVQK